MCYSTTCSLLSLKCMSYVYPPLSVLQRLALSFYELVLCRAKDLITFLCCLRCFSYFMAGYMLGCIGAAKWLVPYSCLIYSFTAFSGYAKRVSAAVSGDHRAQQLRYRHSVAGSECGRHLCHAGIGLSWIALSSVVCAIFSQFHLP